MSFFAAKNKSTLDCLFLLVNGLVDFLLHGLAKHDCGENQVQNKGTNRRLSSIVSRFPSFKSLANEVA